MLYFQRHDILSRPVLSPLFSVVYHSWLLCIPLLILGKPFPILDKPFPILSKPFPIPGILFPIMGKPFPVLGIPFPILASNWTGVGQYYSQGAGGPGIWRPGLAGISTICTVSELRYLTYTTRQICLNQQMFKATWRFWLSLHLYKFWIQKPPNLWNFGFTQQLLFTISGSRYISISADSGRFLYELRAALHNSVLRWGEVKAGLTTQSLDQRYNFILGSILRVK